MVQELHGQIFFNYVYLLELPPSGTIGPYLSQPSSISGLLTFQISV